MISDVIVETLPDAGHLFADLGKIPTQAAHLILNPVKASVDPTDLELHHGEQRCESNSEDRNKRCVHHSKLGRITSV